MNKAQAIQLFMDYGNIAAKSRDEAERIPPTEAQLNAAVEVVIRNAHEAKRILLEPRTPQR